MIKEIVESKIKSLVSKFEANKYHYLSKNYLEEEVKVEFINPLFEALGWDVRNVKGLSPYEKDVVFEKGETTGHPDYNFRIDGQTKFFVEAKAPHEPLHKINHVLQAKSYAWNTKNVFIVLLTDFEEFRLFDATIKPDPKHPDQGIIYELTYDKYLDHIDDLLTLSRENVEKGLLDRLIQKIRVPKSLRKPVDEAFLEDISKWREELAKDIYKRNIRELEDKTDKGKTKIQVKILNEAVQKILDKLIFIRIAEDRKIIAPKSLLDEVEWWKAGGKKRDLHRRLADRFLGWNQDFNGEILKPGPCDVLNIDSNLLARIIENLYFPKCPYLFDVIGVELLGSIYERYLGKTIRVTPKRVKIEEKPEVRKSGGVYYTPQYIVDYIVKNTVGEIIKRKTPKQIDKIKILDPACGSGSFLLTTFQTLIDYHIDYYEKHPEESEQGKLFSDVIINYDGTKRLSIEKKAQILRNNIFGVDIDPQAVEIAMMSLYLKCLEGEKDLPRKRELLPSLAKNIRCGNSLISYDIQDQLALFDEEEKERINPFDSYSKATGFGQIMEQGGFNAVIGNPPWGAEFSFQEKKYLINKFSAVHMRTPDSFNYFLALSISLLTSNGLLGMIIPNNFLFQHEYAKSRKYFVDDNHLIHSINLGDGVFEITAPSCMVIIKKCKKGKKITSVADLRNRPRDLLSIALKDVNYSSVSSTEILSTPDNIIPMDVESIKLLNRIYSSAETLLGDLCTDVSAGIGTGGDKIFRIEDNLAKSLKIESNILFPVLIGREINSYYTPEKSGYSIIYSTKAISKKTHPNTLFYLDPFKEKLSKKRETVKGLIPWWSLHWPRNKNLFASPKIILKQTSDSLYTTIDFKGYYCLNSIIIIKLRNNTLIEYLCGLLNSRIMRWAYRQLTQETSRTFAEVKPVNLRKLPIRRINFNNTREKSLHGKIVKLTNKMLDLNKNKNKLPPSSKREIIEREIQITAEKIDELVYELYGITEEERKAIEEGI